ncbi:MAG: DNA cytosine methyltransferase, partial [Halobacteriaceae archaeon]
MEGGMTWTCLDLFCGLGGFSAAFAESDEWDVVTVDIEERFDPDICADVLDLRPSDFDREFDVVLASPPCTYFSQARLQWGRSFDTDGKPYTDDAAESVALVYHTLGLIHATYPDYWFMENPQGYLRHVIGLPEATIDYCAYGHYTKKPTDLWGDHPPMTYRRCG